MDYAEALNLVQAAKPKDNYMAIEVTYDKKILLPYKDGVTFLAALNSAEQIELPYGKPHRITEFARDAITVTIMSHAEYVRFKIAALLGVSPEDVKGQEPVAA